MKVKVELEIASGNAAFADDPNIEVSRIMKAVATKIMLSGPEEGESQSFDLHDINGNKVGFCYCRIDPDED